MSDDQHIDHVEYADSDGEIPNKESVISNQRKQDEFQPHTAQEKGQLVPNNSEAITRLIQNNTDEGKLKQQVQEQHHAETNNQQIVDQQKQEVNNEDEVYKHSAEAREQQEIKQVQAKQAENVEQIIKVNNYINRNWHIVKAELASPDMLVDVQQLKNQESNPLNHQEQCAELLDQKVADDQVPKQVLENVSHLKSQGQRPELQNNEQEEVINEKEDDLSSNLVAQNNEQKSAQHVSNNQTNSVLDRAIYQQNLSDMRIAQLDSEINQQSKQIEQHKIQVKQNEVQIQKQQHYDQEQKVFEEQKVQAIHSNELEKVENHQNQNGLSLSEQKIKIQRRDTKQLKEMIPKGVRTRNNAPPKLQQNASQNSKACKCEVM